MNKLLAALASCALLACALLASPPAHARNQVWNQATWIISAGGGGSTVYSGAIALFVGDATACNVAVQPIDQATATTLTNVQSGEIIPIAVKQIPASGTTCAAVFVLGATGN